MDQYVYKVKIFNPTKKRDFVVRQLHHFNGKFTCIQHVKEILVKEYKSEIPDNMTNVGYFEGRSHTKRWIATQEDLTAMYARFSPGNEIFLWCIGKEEEEEELSHQHGVKRKSDGAVNKRQAREDELDSIYDRLKEKHGDMYSTPQYRLWARMIICGTHDDLDTPPQVPMIVGAPLPKRPKQESLTSALVDAATAFANVISPTSCSSNAESSTEPSTPKIPGRGISRTGVSPGRVADVRMKNLEQLRFMQNLLDDGILSTEEFDEQKQLILNTLRKL